MCGALQRSTDGSQVLLAILEEERQRQRASFYTQISQAQSQPQSHSQPRGDASHRLRPPSTAALRAPPRPWKLPGGSARGGEEAEAETAALLRVSDFDDGDTTLTHAHTLTLTDRTAPPTPAPAAAPEARSANGAALSATSVPGASRSSAAHRQRVIAVMGSVFGLSSPLPLGAAASADSSASAVSAVAAPSPSFESTPEPLPHRSFQLFRGFARHVVAAAPSALPRPRDDSPPPPLPASAVQVVARFFFDNYM